MAKTIFCVDDSETIRMLIRKTLEPQGFILREAIHGVDALKQLESDSGADMFIVDINMPEMDGFEFVKELKAKAEFNDTPVVFLTTEAGVHKKNMGKELGVKGWIVKPFEEQALIKIVKMFTV